MSTKTICDGCGAELNELTTCLRIRRVDGLFDSDLSGEEDAHLCRQCAKTVFDAIKTVQSAIGGQR